uniref:Integral membrane protein n=1 Tax=uncultured Thiotrichaceae bacterium TaxID=298394 RepID=A0A6S6UJN4_9GAMM|nr:MAG: Integral membrane protein [uncultured Thiotrichaceae bacterium]
MDPVTQGVLGAACAQVSSDKIKLAKSALIGALAGMAPDLDILIRSADDPLLYLEFHRQFTHSLLFIPFGGLIVSLFLYPLLAKRWGLSYRLTLLWCIIGVGTHGLLDGCTSYGTQLLWPLSNQRFAWDTISIIDPLFTIPMLALVVWAAVRKWKVLVYAALLWGVTYMTLGFIQHERAMKIGEELAQFRDDPVTRLQAKPSFGNLVIWKVITETEKGFHVDAVKPWLPLLSKSGQQEIWAGDYTDKLDIKRDLPWLNNDSQQAKDIERFRWLSDGHIALDRHNPMRVVDVRYTLLPQQIIPLWGIELDKGAPVEQHADYYVERGDSGAAVRELWEMIF